MEKIQVADIYVSHDKCESVTILSGDRAKLFMLALYPVRCLCGNLLPKNEAYDGIVKRHPIYRPDA